MLDEGWIEIEFPKWNPEGDQLSVIQGSYSCTAIQTLSNTITCSFFDDVLTLTRVFESGDLVAPQTIIFDVEGIKNPMSTGVLDDIQITIYAPGGG